MNYNITLSNAAAQQLVTVLGKLPSSETGELYLLVQQQVMKDIDEQNTSAQDQIVRAKVETISTAKEKLAAFKNAHKSKEAKVLQTDFESAIETFEFDKIANLTTQITDYEAGSAK